ncbi:MAG: CBS domain-containing protein [Clostridiaceae bacterium]
MVSNLITLEPEDTVEYALKLMNQKKINGAPVIDGSGKLLGMIVKADIYRFLMEEGHYDTCPVEWVMTKKVVAASPNDDLVGVAKKLREHNIIAIPVVEEDNTLKGILTVEDIVDYFLSEN